jgi:DNA-binding transcriptional MerR regulator
MLTIGKLAEATGVPPSKIRYYEKVGVLPEPARTENGYRAYGEEALARLAFLQRGKLLGLSLTELAELARAADEGCCDATKPLMAQLLSDRLGEVDRQLAELGVLREEIEGALVRLAGSARPPAPEVELACGNGAPTRCANPDG